MKPIKAIILYEYDLVLFWSLCRTDAIDPMLSTLAEIFDVLALR